MVDITPDSADAGEHRLTAPATVVALSVTVVSLFGLLASSGGTGPAHVVGATFGAAIFGYLTYWIARDVRDSVRPDRSA